MFVCVCVPCVCCRRPGPLGMGNRSAVDGFLLDDNWNLWSGPSEVRRTHPSPSARPKRGALLRACTLACADRVLTVCLHAQNVVCCCVRACTFACSSDSFGLRVKMILRPQEVIALNAMLFNLGLFGLFGVFGCVRCLASCKVRASCQAVPRSRRFTVTGAKRCVCVCA